MRREEVVDFGDRHSGIKLTVTRRGIEVSGHYDSFIGLEGGEVTWLSLDEMREKVNRVQKRDRD